MARGAEEVVLLTVETLIRKHYLVGFSVLSVVFDVFSGLVNESKINFVNHLLRSRCTRVTCTSFQPFLSFSSSVQRECPLEVALRARRYSVSSSTT